MTDASGKLPPETQKAVDEFVAVAAHNARLRREIAKAERPKRIGQALAVVLATYFLLWLGGSVSYNYTHECVRSHIIPGDPGDRDPDTHQGGGDKTVCDWTVDSGHRWTILGPLRLFRTGALHLPGT